MQVEYNIEDETVSLSAELPDIEESVDDRVADVFCDLSIATLLDVQTGEQSAIRHRTRGHADGVTHAVDTEDWAEAFVDRLSDSGYTTRDAWELVDSVYAEREIPLSVTVQTVST